MKTVGEWIMPIGCALLTIASFSAGNQWEVWWAAGLIMAHRNVTHC